jgi:hypothetical protein
MKWSPASLNGLQYALGSWIVEGDGKNATALSPFSLSGAWPIVDWKRRYAFFIMPKESMKEPSRNTYTELKQEVDGYFKK